MSLIVTKRPKSQINILDKRIPRNPKYANILPTIDTGDSLTKFLKRNEELRASKRQQAGEIFKRMKISTLIQLIIQVAEIHALECVKTVENGPDSLDQLSADTDRPQTQDTVRSAASSRSTLQNVIRGVGEMDGYNNSKECCTNTLLTPQSTNGDSIDLAYKECPYLIVDLRDKDEFNTNHIVSAHHYPATMLSRCTNNESRELLIYKNQKGKIIILYDEDERIAPRAVTVMVERGYNNVFMLSGGLKYAMRKFPRGLITGTCPVAWTLSSVPSTPTANTRRAQSAHLPRTESSIGQTVAQVTRLAPGPMIKFDAREQFTQHDIEELNTQLEDHLLPRDMATRLSRPNTHLSTQSSRVSVASERSNLSNVSDKPWKP